jgi:mannose-6-phosphate isomerase
MSPLYPLSFRPLFKRYLWGGRRLGSVLNKPIGEGDDYAESWEIADHASGQSVVASGPLVGTTLHELVVSRGDELLGRHAPKPRFPLLFKYLDCQRDLSVQVHPSDAAAAKLDPPDFGKTEAWVIVEAQPGSRLFAGLKRGCDRESLVAALREDKLEPCLHELRPRGGDCVFIPAGTIHALGEGLLVAEIQQASDTTYRLYDWGRVGPDGQPRKLHVEEALAVTDFAACEIRPQPAQPTDRPHVERLVQCDKFVLDRLTVLGESPVGGDERFHIVSVLEGQLDLRTADEEPELALNKGQTVLLPACLPPAVVAGRGRAVALDMYLR